MTGENLDDLTILRELDEPIAEDELDAAAERSGETLEELREEGVGIRWVESGVLTNEEGEITGTFCHYRAEDEEAIREHAARARFPATRLDSRGQPLDGE